MRGALIDRRRRSSFKRIGASPMQQLQDPSKDRRATNEAGAAHHPDSSARANSDWGAIVEVPDHDPVTQRPPDGGLMKSKDRMPINAC
jgi:hypothetical protein